MSVGLKILSRYLRTVATLIFQGSPVFLSQVDENPENYTNPYLTLLITISLLTGIVTLYYNFENVTWLGQQFFEGIERVAIFHAICSVIIYLILLVIPNKLAASRWPINGNVVGIKKIFEYHCWVFPLNIPYFFTIPIVVHFLHEFRLLVNLPGVLYSIIVWWFYIVPGLANIYNESRIRTAVGTFLWDFAFAFMIGFIYGFIRGFYMTYTGLM